MVDRFKRNIKRLEATSLENSVFSFKDFEDFEITYYVLAVMNGAMSYKQIPEDKLVKAFFRFIRITENIGFRDYFEVYQEKLEIENLITAFGCKKDLFEFYNFKDFEKLYYFLKVEKGASLRSIPREQLFDVICLAHAVGFIFTNPDDCKKVVETYGPALKLVEKKCRSTEICLIALKNTRSACRVIKYIPEEVFDASEEIQRIFKEIAESDDIYYV